MTRFHSAGGSLHENTGDRIVERDPFEVRRWAESWAREALALQHTNPDLARIIAHDALEAELALSAWKDQRKAATGRDPFEEAA